MISIECISEQVKFYSRASENAYDFTTVTKEFVVENRCKWKFRYRSYTEAKYCLFFSLDEILHLDFDICISIERAKILWKQFI